MVKLIQCLHRLPQLSPEEFHNHWLRCHAPMVNRIRGVRSYVQYHTIEQNPMARPKVSGVKPFDGFAAWCWDTLEALREEMKQGGDYRDVLEDEALFIDHSRSLICLTEERVIVEVEGLPPYVLIECHRHRPDLSREVFQNSWFNIHGGYGRSIHAQGLMSGFIQNHVVSHKAEVELLKEIGIDTDTFDGIGMAYFESIAKFKRMISLPVVKDEAFDAEDDFDDHERMVSVLAVRHPIKSIVR
jgi:hypothetical protein